MVPGLDASVILIDLAKLPSREVASTVNKRVSYHLTQRRTCCLFIYFLFFLINLFLAALDLRCCAWAFSSCSERGLLFVVVHTLLIAVASLVVEHGI